MDVADEPIAVLRGKKGTVPDQPTVGARRNGPKGASHKLERSPFPGNFET